jgi:hypothetical protein
MSFPGTLSASLANLEMDSTQCAAFVAPDPDIAGIGVLLSVDAKLSLVSNIPIFSVRRPVFEVDPCGT